MINIVFQNETVKSIFKTVMKKYQQILTENLIWNKNRYVNIIIQFLNYYSHKCNLATGNTRYHSSIHAS